MCVSRLVIPAQNSKSPRFVSRISGEETAITGIVFLLLYDLVSRIFCIAVFVVVFYNIFSHTGLLAKVFEKILLGIPSM